MTTDKTLLIDGDILVYKHAFGAEEDHSFDEGDDLVVANIDQAVTQMVQEVEDLKEKFSADALVCLTDRHHNYRKDLLPTYKAGRGKKPVAFNDMLAAAHSVFDVAHRESMEADDVMGIFMTGDQVIRGRKCIVSADKDMQTIPGNLYNPRHPKVGVRKITRKQADRFFLTQVLTGDAVDNYKGCPGIGPVKAEKILDDAKCHWTAIVKTYESKGLTEADALIQARCARILRASDYDFKRRRINLWTPKSSPR